MTQRLESGIVFLRYVHICIGYVRQTTTLTGRIIWEVFGEIKQIDHFAFSLLYVYEFI